MKILITTDWYDPAVNGVVTSVLNLAKGLRDRGHEVRILTLSADLHSHIDRDTGVYFIGSVSMAKIYPCARMRTVSARWIVDELAAWCPDIIHSQCEFSTFSFARRISRICGCPIVHTWHTVYEEFTHYFSPSRKAGRVAAEMVAGYVLSHVQGVIAPSEKIRRMLERYPVSRCPEIHVVPTGLDLSRLCREDAAGVPADCSRTAEKESLRSDLGFSPEDTVLLSLGRTAREKNIDELLHYLALQDNPHLKMLIVGDGPYRKNLEGTARLLGIRDRVVFTGMVDPEKVSSYYRLADVFVCASQSETQGLTYMEAMACGCSMLCRQDPCLDGVITDGRNGFIYTDEREFSEKLRILTDQPRAAMEMGKRGAESVRQRYSIENFALSAENVYCRTINASKAVAEPERRCPHGWFKVSEEGNADCHGAEPGSQRDTVSLGMAGRHLLFAGKTAAVH